MPDFVWVDGCTVRYHRMGDSREDPLILIHGAMAHSGWWHSAAAYLAPFHSLVLLELSGHGDSEHRDQYDFYTWSKEVRAVIAALGADRVSLVGHSMGGLLTLHVAATYPDVVRAVVCVDSAVIPRPQIPRRATEVKFYPTRAEGIRNFRLRPRATCADSQTLSVIASQGLRETSRGWRWKFDPAVAHRIPRDVLNASIAEIRCPIGFVYGASSEVASRATVERLAELHGKAVPSVAVAGAFHHVPVDAPARTAAAIEILLANTRDQG